MTPHSHEALPLTITEEVWSSLPESDREAANTVYEAAFPPHERRDLQEVVDAGSRVWIGRNDGTAIALALMGRLPRSRLGFLQYVAVARAHRSTGAGSAMLTSLSSALELEELPGLLFEIEIPEGGGSSERRRRLQFYERWGAEQIRCLRGYYMADFSTVGMRLPMLLLWRPLRILAQPRGDALRAALTDIFETEYANHADARFLEDLLAQVIC